MEITVTVKLTEGMVYDAMKEAVQEFFTNLPSQENKRSALYMSVHRTARHIQVRSIRGRCGTFGRKQEVHLCH